MSPLQKNAVERSVKARKQRVANYKALLREISLRAMDIAEMAELINVEWPTVHKYYLAMLRFGVIQRAGRKVGEKANRTEYIRAGDIAKERRFITFIESCETCEDELGHPRRRAEEIAALAVRTIVVTEARQIGAKRDDLVAALFGQPKRQLDLLGDIE